ncbi:hypothetical protein VFPPC_01123 [Pochonia chlamydosporia 170]|uniref:SET domain-containing protein n=1 Tax=Pochonia chlamydosporia 170 TaxID=1380566 RepID=A0A179G8B1_METCM|nr:hypothetical protein VFPPC_01123 [Pochonia chlamydosporia 170]OAQ73409.1 hypothetical protein VFPPC_01123 [Pochonia chlamydosporia 170]
MKPSGISGKQCEPLVAFQVCDNASRLDPTAPDNSKCTVIQERQHESQPEEHNCAANILNNIPNAETPRLLDSNSPDKADDEWGPPLPQLTPPPVFENKYFRVVSSHTAGLGAIACRPLRRGDIILCEEPLFTSDSQNVFSEFAKLSEEQKKVAMSLHANQLMKPGTSDVYAIWTTNW